MVLNSNHHATLMAKIPNPQSYVGSVVMSGAYCFPQASTTVEQIGSWGLSNLLRTSTHSHRNSVKEMKSIDLLDYSDPSSVTD
jgi:hypothetical protein